MCNLKREHNWTYLQSSETHNQNTFFLLPKQQWGVTDGQRCRHNRQTTSFRQSPGSQTQCLVIIYTRKDLEKYMCVLCHVWLIATPWTVAHQVPLSMEFSRQEYWSGCSFLFQGFFLTLGSNHISCISWIGRQIPYGCAIWETHICMYVFITMYKTILYITESLCSTLETNTTLYINYTTVNK